MLLSGCELLREGETDDRHIISNCSLKLPDGTHMQCIHDLEKNEDISVEGASFEK